MDAVELLLARVPATELALELAQQLLVDLGCGFGDADRIQHQGCSTILVCALLGQEVREGLQQVEVARRVDQALLEVLRGDLGLAAQQRVLGPGEVRARDLLATALDLAQLEDPVLPDRIELGDRLGQLEPVVVRDVLGRRLRMVEHGRLEVLDGAIADPPARAVHELAERLAVDEASVDAVLIIVEEVDQPPGRRIPSRTPLVAILDDDAEGRRLLGHGVGVRRVDAVVGAGHPAHLHPIGEREQAVVGRQVHDHRAVGQDARALEERGQPFVEPARGARRERDELVGGLVEQSPGHALEPTAADVGLDRVAGEVAGRPLDGRTDAFLEVLVTILEDVQADLRHRAAGLFRAVLEEDAVEGIHLLHGLGRAHHDLVACVGVGHVVLAVLLGALLPGRVLGVELGDPLLGHVGEQVLRFGVAGQAGIGARGDALDRGGAGLVLRIERQDFLVDTDRRVRAVVLLVGVGEGLELVEEKILQPEQVGSEWVDGFERHAQVLEVLLLPALDLGQVVVPMAAEQLLVGLARGGGAAGAQVPCGERLRVALQRAQYLGVGRVGVAARERALGALQDEREVRGLFRGAGERAQGGAAEQQSCAEQRGEAGAKGGHEGVDREREWGSGAQGRPLSIPEAVSLGAS